MEIDKSVAVMRLIFCAKKLFYSLGYDNYIQITKGEKKMKKKKSRKKYFLQTMVVAVLCFVAFIMLQNKIVFLDQGLSNLGIGILYFVLVYILMRIDMKYTRSLISAITNAILPLTVYVIYGVGMLNKKTIILVLFYIATLIAVEFFFSNNTKGKRKEDIKKYLLHRLKYELIFVFIASVILLPVFGVELRMNDNEHFIDSMKTEIVEMKEAYLLKENLKEASKIEEWEALSDKEKEEILNVFLKIEAGKYGMNILPELIIVELEENCLGKYSKEYDTIYIHSKMVQKETDPYIVLHVLCHEMNHRFQHIEVEFMEKIMDDPEYEVYHNSKMFEDIKVYAKEFKNYVPGDTEENYEDYAEQSIEIAAESYAQNAVREYKNCIEEFRKEI